MKCSLFAYPKKAQSARAVLCCAVKSVAQSRIAVKPFLDFSVLSELTKLPNRLLLPAQVAITEHRGRYSVFIVE